MDKDPETGRFKHGNRAARGTGLICPHCGKALKIYTSLKLVKIPRSELPEEPYFCQGCETWRKRTSNYPRERDGKLLCRECY